MKIHYPILREFGRRKIFPRKLRVLLAKTFAGDEISCKPTDFAVNLYGKKFFGSTKSHIDWHVYFLGEYDPIGVALLRQLASKIESPTFIDIGANIGTHTLPLVDVCHQIHCFEPYPPNLERLKKHMDFNQIRNVKIHAFGLSETDQVASYYENESNNLGAGSFEETHNPKSNKEPISLPIKCGDVVFDSLNIQESSLFKIDVEGHEPSVLKGLTKHLARARPLIFWECGPTTLSKVTTYDELMGLFPEDYEIFHVRFRSRWSRSTPRLIAYEYPKQGNLLSVPKEKMNLIQDLLA